MAERIFKQIRSFILVNFIYKTSEDVYPIAFSTILFFVKNVCYKGTGEQKLSSQRV